MSVHVHIAEGPLSPAAPWSPPGAGAVLCFDGVVRPSEDGSPIDALDYSAYRPMTERQLAALAGTALARFGLVAVRVEHSTGRVPAGACSFRLRIASKHRKEGLAAADWFIDEMKRDVPIWKTPVPMPADAQPHPEATR